MHAGNKEKTQSPMKKARWAAATASMRLMRGCDGCAHAHEAAAASLHARVAAAASQHACTAAAANQHTHTVVAWRR